MTRIHASCVAIKSQGILLVGRSGSGKSDLALRLIDRGATLVSDDYTDIEARDGCLIARAPPTIAGLIEVRGIGIVALTSVPEVPVVLHVVLDDEVPRLPEPDVSVQFEGLTIPSLALAGLEPSAPIKLEMALARVLKVHT